MSLASAGVRAAMIPRTGQTPCTAKEGLVNDNPLRFQEPHAHLASPFGPDTFGRRAEAFARFFGTPKFLIGQSLVVVAWIAINVTAASLRWDPYPFILLNLAFSTQAAYAAPLILLAQTRQADRDKAHAEADARHREELARANRELLSRNTELTEQTRRLAEHVDSLTRQIHRQVVPA
jgi:uncharacterized membrane protein